MANCGKMPDCDTQYKSLAIVDYVGGGEEVPESEVVAAAVTLYINRFYPDLLSVK